MSKVIEQIRVNYPIDLVVEAIRDISLKTASPLTENDHIFTIKLRLKKSLLGSPTPASVMLQLKESAKVENATVVKFTAANIGIGPLQIRECQKKLDSMKELLLNELELLTQQGKELVTANNKTCRTRKIKPKSFKLS